MRSGAKVDLLTIFEPRIPVPNVPDRRGSARCEQRDRCAAAAQIRAVRSEQRRRFDGHFPWPVRLEVGNSGHVIVETARRTGADLVVVGLGSGAPLVRHGGVPTPVCVSPYVEIPLLG
jgi:hypothetical protein